jgi:carbon storage regulator
MLVLTRRSEESIVIGGNIVVTILSVEGEKVKLGIEAPREIAILRRELIGGIETQNRPAEKLIPGPEPPMAQGLGGIFTGELGDGEPPQPPA